MVCHGITHMLSTLSSHLPVTAELQMGSLLLAQSKISLSSFLFLKHVRGVGQIFWIFFWKTISMCSVSGMDEAPPEEVIARSPRYHLYWFHDDVPHGTVSGETHQSP